MEKTLWVIITPQECITQSEKILTSLLASAITSWWLNRKHRQIGVGISPELHFLLFVEGKEGVFHRRANPENPTALKLFGFFALFLLSQWIHFVHTPVESIAYSCYFIMETHLHQSALAYKKELDAGLARRILFPNFPGWIVM